MSTSQAARGAGAPTLPASGCHPVPPLQQPDPLVGAVLPGGYHVLDLLSVGGMGRVYRAEQRALGRTVAVKVIHPHLLSDESAATRFLIEARAASQLNHPNSVAVFDFGRTEDGQPYIVMEFLRGRDLATVAYQEGPFELERVIDVLQQVLAALGEAHAAGIVHRDMKPENVILEPLRRGGDLVKVVDFGLAKLRLEAAQTKLTTPGFVCGTPDYMSPEQGRGDAIDGRTDLYAVGVMLFELLTGRLPYEGRSPMQVVMMHVTVPVPDPRSVAPDRSIPPELAAICMRAIAKQPAERFEEAQELSDALEAVLRAPREEVQTPAPARVACPGCGAQVATAKFCLECGGRLACEGVAEMLDACESGESFQALILLEQAATRAAAKGDSTTEILALRRGLAVARREIARGELDDPLGAVAIFSRKLASALNRSGRHADAEGVLKESLDLAPPSGSERAQLLAELARVARARGRTSEALHRLEAALEAARGAGDGDLVTSLIALRSGWP
jgi:hypothetical protein